MNELEALERRKEVGGADQFKVPAAAREVEEQEKSGKALEAEVRAVPLGPGCRPILNVGGPDDHSPGNLW